MEQAFILLAQAGDDPTLLWIKAATGVVLFLFVAVFILAVFGQRGRAEMTPEREIALAAGHVDRQTVFENPVVQPIMWLLLTAARQLFGPKVKRKIRANLVAAGSPNFYTSEEYLALSLLWGIGCALALELGNILVSESSGFLTHVTVTVFGFAAGFGGLVYHLHTVAAKRVRLISKRVPYTLDLIALAMGAGATFTEAVRTVVHEDPEHPFNVELNTVLAEVELGTTRATALRNMAERIPLETLRAIVAAVIQSESLGTPLSDVLKGQASLLRLQRSVRAEKLAAQASVRILLPSMLILMSVVLAIFAPFIIKGLRRELFG